MKCIFAMIFLIAPFLYAADAPPPQKLVGGTPMQWSVRMADSEMARRGDSLAWREGGTAKWDYTTGLLMWLDGLYMGSPFHAEYAKLFHEPTTSFDDVAKQIRLVAAHT